MKRILFVTDTYFPDSGATTTIVKRTAESLTGLGYDVSVYPAEISGMHLTYPGNCNGVKILKPDAGAAGNICKDQCRNTCPERCKDKVRSIEKILDDTDYDYVFSVAVAFEVNFLTHSAIRGRKCAWFPMSYDPYAFNPHITDEQRSERVKQEIDVLKDAEKIFFLTEFNEDYKGSPVEGKIEYFNLPCMREIAPDPNKKVIGFDDSYVNCVFLGDFYYGVENTDFIFRLFEKLDSRIRLYTVGNPGDYQDTIDMWKRKLGNRYFCHPRVSQEEAHNAMLDCDVLVSMGHDSPNMCPSKAIDFAASGKPVLHISKIENCCAQKYLDRYPEKCFIYQKEDLSADRINAVEQFILHSKGRERIPFDTVRKLYSDFTMEELIGKIIGAF